MMSSPMNNSNAHTLFGAMLHRVYGRETLVQAVKTGLADWHFPTTMAGHAWDYFRECHDEGETPNVFAMRTYIVTQSNIPDTSVDLGLLVAEAMAASDLVSVNERDVDRAARAIIDAGRRRRMRAETAGFLTELVESAYPTDTVEGLHERYHTRCEDVLSVDLSTGNSMVDIGATALAQAERQDESSRTYQTGISGLDRMMSFRPSVHTILGALSGHGKSTMGAAIAAGLARCNDDIEVVWFSTEMPARLVALSLDTHLREVPLHDESSERIAAMMGAPASNHIHIIDSKANGRRALSVADIRRHVMQVRAQRPGAQLVVVVDYLQRVHSETDDQHLRVARISGAIADFATSHDLITIAMTQFTTRTEDAPIPMPKPSEARWARDIENDAANFLIYHRPYPRTANRTTHCVLQLAKARYGEVSHISMRLESRQKFVWSSVVDSDEVPGLTSYEHRAPAEDYPI